MLMRAIVAMALTTSLVVGSNAGAHSAAEGRRGGVGREDATPRPSRNSCCHHAGPVHLRLSRVPAERDELGPRAARVVGEHGVHVEREPSA